MCLFIHVLGIYNGVTDYYNHSYCNLLECGMEFHTGDGPFWDHNNEYSTFIYTKEVEHIVQQHDQERVGILVSIGGHSDSILFVAIEYFKLSNYSKVFPSSACILH